MKAEITIPTSLNDITIGQYQKIKQLSEKEELKGTDLDNEILKVVLGFDNVEDISKKDKDMLIQDVSRALVDEGRFQQTFEFKGVHYGLIPNFDKISSGEHADMIKYCDEIEDAHRFIAVCYRPIIMRDWFSSYRVRSYNGTSEQAENMRNIPMSIYNGAKVFFWTIYNDLNEHIQRSIREEQAKEFTL